MEEIQGPILPLLHKSLGISNQNKQSWQLQQLKQFQAEAPISFCFLGLIVIFFFIIQEWIPKTH